MSHSEIEVQCFHSSAVACMEGSQRAAVMAAANK